MEENTNVSRAVEEIKGTDEEQLEKVVSDWFEKTRTSGMKLGAYFISAAVMDAINKNLKDGMKSSHRDFERAIKRVIEIVSVQLNLKTVQNDLEEETNDGTAE